MKRAHGFTMVELIVVIVLIGVIGGTMVMVFRPALQSYLDVGRRADLSNQADTAVRRLVSEVRSAVPNSLRWNADGLGTQCLELVPTIDGGRFRTGPDTEWDAVAARPRSAFIDGTAAITAFDVLTPLGAATAGDIVVIGNQDTDQVYSRTNTGVIARVEPAPTDGGQSPGVQRITLTGPVQFPPGSDSGRFVVASGTQQAVTYQCTAGIDLATDTGTGRLLRIRGYGFSASQVCPLDQANGQVVATKVSACQILYDPNQGATQQSGYVQVRLTVRDSGESVTMVYSAHVANVP